MSTSISMTNAISGALQTLLFSNKAADSLFRGVVEAGSTVNTSGAVLSPDGGS